MDGETGDDAPTRRELQEQVDELQETVRKMMPGRRRVLKGVGAGALFGVGAVSGANAAPGDDGDTVWGSDSNRDDYYADEIDAISVSTAKADITGETVVLAEGAGTNLTAANNTYTAVEFDNVLLDNTGDWNGTDTFTPPEGGTYRFSGMVAITPGADQDRIRIRLRNTTDGATVGGYLQIRSHLTSNIFPPIQWIADLAQGKNYQIQATNIDSSLEIVQSVLTRLQIERVLLA